MKQKATKDFLIRKMPIELYLVLEKAAMEHHRSKTQEAIIAISKGLESYSHRLRKPEPFKWENEISSKFIQQAIEEGRA